METAVPTITKIVQSVFKENNRDNSSEMFSISIWK